MKNNKTVKEAAVPEECAECKQHQVVNARLQASVNEYKKAYDTLKMKLQTIFNITQL